MKRILYSKLLDWKESTRRKPLLLRGARQTGKTYLLSAFGQNEYEDLIYVNFEKDKSLTDFFAENIDPKELIRNLSIYTGQNILPEKHLIFFDEIQVSNRALNSLKYFFEQAPEYHVVAAGSLLGIAVSGPDSFPVGKVNFLDLYPVTFFEFLEAIGRKELKDSLLWWQHPKPYPEPFHKELNRHLQTYYFVGGMPEAVDYYATSKDVQEVREIQKEIIGAYVLDFAKYAVAPDIPKLRMIWDSIPAQLSKENKKFVFSTLKKNARMRDFENAILWLEKAGLIHRVFRLSTAKKPLKAYAKDNIFKIYGLDVGLLGALANLTAKDILQGSYHLHEFKGALAENYVVQELKATHGFDLFYWESSGSAEVDIVLESSGRIFPLEVKAGTNFKSQSLKSFDKKFNPDQLGRTSLLNLKYDNKLLNIPLYAISRLPYYI